MEAEVRGWLAEPFRENRTAQALKQACLSEPVSASSISTCQMSQHHMPLSSSFPPPPSPRARLTPGVLFVETSSLTGENASTPFLLAARAILEQIDAGTIDPDVAGSGVSYGERQLRAVGSSGRLNSGNGFTPWRRRRRDSISIRDMVGSGSRCSC